MSLIFLKVTPKKFDLKFMTTLCNEIVMKPAKPVKEFFKSGLNFSHHAGFPDRHFDYY